ncbi:MAG: AAA family ATPase [Campylobacterales bacterium]|nr:AAA family ATPase [Campylobacterales bacterium]
MSQWLNAARVLEENTKEGNYFEAQSGIYALKRVQTLLETTFPQMMFLLGEPGSGKSFMLHHLKRLYEKKRLCVLIENPFLTPAQLLQRLLSCKGVVVDSSDVEALRLQAVEAYAGVDHLIMLDEAQLMSAQLREFVRILSDSKVFYFLIAMHKKEGEEMLSLAHFHSRPHQVIYLGDLQPAECMPYLTKELHSVGFFDVEALLSKRLVAEAWRYSKGNFRNFKKCFYHLFLLLDYAQTQQKKEFAKPSLILLRMASIRARVLASELNTDDFDQLLHEARRKSGGRGRALTASVLMLLGGGIVWYYVHTVVLSPASTLSVSAPVAPLHVEAPKPVVAPVEEVKKPVVEPLPRAEVPAEQVLVEQTPVVAEPLHVEVQMQEAPSVVAEVEKEVLIQADEVASVLQNPHLSPPTSLPKTIRVLPFKGVSAASGLSEDL